jgi:uncharacterized tellurite resistance protein B-like protein
MDIWEKYRNQTDQTICIIGVIILGVKLCEADGNFSEYERDEMLKTIPHSKDKEKEIKEIILEAEKDTNPIDHHAELIKKFIDQDHREFLEFIIAVLIKFAKSDHRYSEIEKSTIKRVAKIFGIYDDSNFFEKISRKFLYRSVENV